MLINNVFFLGWDVHFAVWPRTTFSRAFSVSIEDGDLELQLCRFELLICKQKIKPNTPCGVKLNE